jgi:hypothetical protein
MSKHILLDDSTKESGAQLHNIDGKRSKRKLRDQREWGELVDDALLDPS